MRIMTSADMSEFLWNSTGPVAVRWFHYSERADGVGGCSLKAGGREAFVPTSARVDGVWLYYSADVVRALQGRGVEVGEYLDGAAQGR